MSSFNKINKQQDNGWYIRNFSNVQLCQPDEKIQFELDGVVEKRLSRLIVLKIWNFVFLVWITQP